MNSTQPQPLQNFAEFWPFYLGEHRDPKSRALHYFGTISSNLILIFLIFYQLWLYIPLVLVAGYGPAWVGHYVIEKNRPATFKHPFWSLLGDYKMLYYALTGQLKNELKRLN